MNERVHIFKYINLLLTPAALMLAGRAIQYLSQLIMVLVVPKVLAPELYVKLNLVLPLAFLGVSLVFGWMINAIYRHVFELLDTSSDRFKQTVFFYYASVSLLLFLIAFIGQIYTSSVYTLIPVLLVAAALKNGVLGVLNTSGNSKGFLLTNTGFAISLLLFVVLSFLDTENKLSRNLIIYASIDIFVACIAWWLLGVFRIPPFPKFSRDIASRYFRYGSPLVAKMMGIWVISLSDRYFLTFWEGSKEVASYILSYQLAGSAITIPMSFVMAIVFPKILKIEKNESQKEALSYTYKLLRIYSRFMIPVFIIVSFVVIMFQYYIYPNYHFTPYIIVIIVLAHIIFELSHFYNKEFELNGRTIVVTKGIAIGAIVNVVLNLVLIPFFGGIGAAIATLLAYSVAVYITYNMREYRP